MVRPIAIGEYTDNRLNKNDAHSSQFYRNSCKNLVTVVNLVGKKITLAGTQNKHYLIDSYMIKMFALIAEIAVDYNRSPTHPNILYGAVVSHLYNRHQTAYCCFAVCRLLWEYNPVFTAVVTVAIISKQKNCACTQTVRPPAKEVALFWIRRNAKRAQRITFPTGTYISTKGILVILHN